MNWDKEHDRMGRIDLIKKPAPKKEPESAEVSQAMNRFMVKIESGGEWHRFIANATNGHHAAATLLELGVPAKAHVGIRLAKEDEQHDEITEDAVKRLAELGWTFNGVKVGA